MLPVLGELFELQQQLNNTHIAASLMCITKLKLSFSYLEKDPMLLLEKIPTMRDLELGRWAYSGRKMVCSAMGFPKLARLKMCNLDNLENWRVEEGSMPILSELTIFDFPKLEELPEGLVYLNFLRKLMLWSMPSEFCDRVRVVNGEQGPDLYKVAHVSDIYIRSDSQEVMYSLVQALRHLHLEDSFTVGEAAVHEAADRVLAATAKGKTRRSRALKIKFSKNLPSRRVTVPGTGARESVKKAIVSMLRLKSKNLPAVQQKVQVLGRLVPGYRKESFSVVLDEASDYIAALEMQVHAMAALSELLSGGSSCGAGSSTLPSTSC